MPNVEMSLDGYGASEAGGEELVVRILPELSGGGDRALESLPPGDYTLVSVETLDDGSVELRYRPNGFDGREPV
jgi:hypothetical protein